MSKILFFDIDGTLLTKDQVIPDSTKEALQMLRRNGHIPIVCTGRARVFIPKQICALGFKGYIAGAGTYSEYEEHIIQNVILPKEKAYDDLVFLMKHKFAPVGEGPANIFLADDHDPRLTQDGVEYNAMFRKKIIGKEKKIDKENIHINKFSAKRLPGYQEKEVCQKLSKDYSIVDHHQELLEFIPKPYSKANGIKQIIKKLGIPQKDTYAFGDGGNDIEMLDFAANSVVMGNGTPEAKQHADYITDDINSDGIYNALCHFKLI